MKKIVVNGIYKHYKGNKYKVVNIATHSETLEKLVVYQALYGEHKIWVRPIDMFVEKVTKDDMIVERFTYITEEKETQLLFESNDDINRYLYENNINLEEELKKEFPELKFKYNYEVNGAKDAALIILCSGIAASFVIASITRMLETILYRPHYVVVEELSEDEKTIQRRTELLQPDIPKSDLTITAEIDSTKAKIKFEDRKE